MAAAEFGLHDAFQQVKTIAYGIWRKRWYAIVTAWLISVVGWFTTMTMPYTYQSSAVVQVNTESILPDVLASVGARIDRKRNSVDLVRRTLVTRDNLQRIIQRTDYLERFAQSERAMDQMISELQRNITIREQGEDLYSFSFAIDDDRMTDRQRAEAAKDVVTALIAIFLESDPNAGSNTADAQEFVEEQRNSFLSRLEARDEEIAQFKQVNLEYISSDAQGSFLQRQTNAENSLRVTVNSIGELEVELNALTKQRENVPPTIRSASRAGRGPEKRDPLETRITDLEKDRDRLLANGFKEKHPDVVNFTRQLESLRKELADKQAAEEEELLASANAGSNSIRSTEEPNKLYEQLTFEIFQKQGELTKLKRRKETQEAEVVEMREKAQEVPKIEAELKKLERDYASLRKQYDSFQRQNQRLEVKAAAENREVSAAIQVIQDANTPSSPTGPARFIMYTVSMGGGILFGIGVAFAFSQLQPVVITVDQLKAQFDLPVLGNVTRALSDREAKMHRMELLFFAGAGGLLVVVYAAFVALDIVSTSGGI